MSDNTNGTVEPFIPASKSLPEITIKGVILAIILTVVLAAANAYLGLRVGTTVSASIPAAVISMGILRFFRESNILENNIVQTAASVGESLAAGIAFILPALIILHYWSHFNYWETVGITLIGGCFGVLFSIPVRRALINDKTLRFPEGVAIGNVLKASANAGSDLGFLVKGGVVGGLIALCQSGFQIFSDYVSYWVIKPKVFYGFGLGFSPALIAAGYIIGISVAISVGVGMLIGWVFGIPLLSMHFGVPTGMSPSDVSDFIWSNYIRYIGVGTMLVGGVWTLLTLLKPVYAGIKTSLNAVKDSKTSGVEIVRTERDVPMMTVFWLSIALAIAVFVMTFNFIEPVVYGDATSMRWVISGVAAVFVLIVGFMMSSVSGYFAGLVGSTNNPASGLIVSAMLMMSLIFVAIFGFYFNLDAPGAHVRAMGGAAVAVMIVSFIASSTVISADTIQDLKAGQIVGATPWKQQVILMLGVVVSALVLPAILQLLFDAYGMGGVFPHAGMPKSQMLAAPQAGLMAAVAQGVLGHNLPWGLLGVGVVIAVIVIFFDEILKKRNMRLPVLAVGVGIYLPLGSSVPVIIGGVLSYLVNRKLVKSKDKKEISTEQYGKNRHNILLLACGLVAGASVMGVLLAFPFAIEQSADAIALFPDSLTWLANILGTVAIVWMLYWMYRTATRQK